MKKVKFVLIVLITILALGYDSTNITDSDVRQKTATLVKKHLKRLKKQEGALKLVGGQDEFEGNVEILHDDRWGAICDDEWDVSEATIVCKQLGYDGKDASATNNSHFGIAKRRYWMDNIYCNGTENELTSCRFDGWGNNDCDPDEAAGVICIEKGRQNSSAGQNNDARKIKLVPLGPTFKIRLHGGRIPQEGYIQVERSPGTWHTICGNGFSLLEALVICRSLGLGFASYALQSNTFDEPSSEFGIFGLQCKGNEENLSDCFYNKEAKGKCPLGNIAVVQCVQDMADLVVDHFEIVRTAHLDDKQMLLLQCAMEENCLASRAYEIQKEDPYWYMETRRLLRFTARILNAGTADFRPFLPKHMWEWHMCHMHYHSMEVFATFDVFDQNGVRVAEGHKASFCLEDNQCIPGVRSRYACANFGDQGISVNCTDIYLFTVDCQWVDITELEPGSYTLKVAVNPEFKVPEMSFENNAAVCQMLYTGTFVAITNCTLQRP